MNFVFCWSPAYFQPDSSSGQFQQLDCLLQYQLFFGDSSDDDDDADRGDGGDFDYDDDIGDEYDDVSFDSSTSCCDINFILEQNTQHAEGFLMQKIILDIF